jgi:ribose 1,5-bisphosphokinase
MEAQSGGFVFVVGPSGAGKDTLIGLAQQALAGDPAFVFPKRLVTRPSSEWEDHDTLDPSVFQAGETEGRFALSWRAHGLGYALPRAALEAAWDGRVVVCNVSRAAIEEGRRRLPNAVVVEVTAPPDLLARRLAERRRGEDGDLRERLVRSTRIGEIAADVTIVNDREPGAAAGKLVAILRQHAQSCGGARSGLSV